MILIVGLGNPGKKYTHTRHNLGFVVVEKFVKGKLSFFPSLKAWKKHEKFHAELCVKNDFIAMKPITYMNLSGEAVEKVVRFYKIPIENLWVIHDDVDLPLGKIRVRKGGGSAGHRGIESIITSLGKDTFWRFRLGIGRGMRDATEKHMDQNLHRHDVETYVVSPFRDTEAGDVKKMIKRAVEVLNIGMQKSPETVMNRFN